MITDIMKAIEELKTNKIPYRFLGPVHKEVVRKLGLWNFEYVDEEKEELVPVGDDSLDSNKIYVFPKDGTYTLEQKTCGVFMGRSGYLEFTNPETGGKIGVHMAPAVGGFAGYNVPGKKNMSPTPTAKVNGVWVQAEAVVIYTGLKQEVKNEKDKKATDNN